jgi:hypothetical protein
MNKVPLCLRAIIFTTAFTLLLGQLVVAQQRRDQAIEDITKAIELKPQETAFYLNRSMSYAKTGGTEKSKNECITVKCAEEPVKLESFAGKVSTKAEM